MRRRSRRRSRLRARIDTQLAPNMAEPDRIGDAGVCHQFAQSGQARLREEQPRQPLRGIEPHQPALKQPFCGRRDLRLTGLRAAAPELERTPLRRSEASKSTWSSSRLMKSRSPGVNPAIVRVCVLPMALIIALAGRPGISRRGRPRAATYRLPGDAEDDINRILLQAPGSGASRRRAI